MPKHHWSSPNSPLLSSKHYFNIHLCHTSILFNFLTMTRDIQDSSPVNILLAYTNLTNYKSYNYASSSNLNTTVIQQWVGNCNSVLDFSCYYDGKFIKYLLKSSPTMC